MMKSFSSGLLFCAFLFVLSGRVAFSETIDAILNQLRTSSETGHFRGMGSGIEIADGVVLTVSHVIEDIGVEYAHQKFDPDQETSDTSFNEGNSVFPRAVSVLSHSEYTLILRKGSSANDSYYTVPVVKDLMMNPEETPQNDAVRILLLSEDAHLDDLTQNLCLDQSITDWTTYRCYTFSDYQLKFSFFAEPFSREINTESGFLKFSETPPCESFICGPSFPLAGGMSGGGVFVQGRLMGLMAQNSRMTYSCGQFDFFKFELKKAGWTHFPEMNIRRCDNAMIIKEVRFDLIFEAIQKWKRG